jgi:pimeloyl-ACP methyl ester carboxylesterase
MSLRSNIVARHALRVVGLVVLLPASVLGLVALLSPATWSGAAYAVGLLVTFVGLVTAPSRIDRRRGIVRGGLGILVLTALVRFGTAARGETAAMHAGADASRGRAALGRLLDEEDVAVTGARVLVATGGLTDPDVRELVPRMKDAYRHMRAEEGDLPSPVVATYLGLQAPGASDTLVFERSSAAAPPPAGALVFLHGFAGSFTLPCWQIARAAARVDLVTFCPSVGYRGDWWTAEGEATLRRTVAEIRARGIDRIWLAGLSNGAAGASRLAPRMPRTFEGLILISGAAPDASPTSLPALVLQGRDDAMMPSSIARAYASRSHARYVELDAGHFAMLVRRDAADRAIEGWLREQMGVSRVTPTGTRDRRRP